jgi:DNA-binding response OmpR family regulator
MANAVLVAEPEASTRGFLERHLADDGFDVLGAAACGEALELAERARPDLVLLGDTSALDECRSWSREVPLIVLGAPEADAVDRARALERGADDFLSRPFLYDELLARIRAVLRRTAPTTPDLVRVGEIEIDRPTRRVTVGGQRIDLPAKEYELLLKLASDPGRVFTKEELLREVWGFQSLGKTRTLDSHASRLRRKLGRAGEGPFVVNVWGVGYRLLGD